MKKTMVLLASMAFAFVTINAQYAFKRTYVFSKDVNRVGLIWQKINEPKIEYWIYKFTYINPGLGWVTFGTSDTTYIFTQDVLADSSLLCVAAKDSAGNLGIPSDTVKVAFRPAAVIPPPIEPPAQDALPFTDETFRQPKWIYTENRIDPFTKFLNLTALFGPGLYADSGSVSTIIPMKKGQIKCVVYGCGAYGNSKITVSIGSMYQTQFQTKGTRGSTTVYPNEFVFDVSVNGPFVYKIYMTNGMARKTIVSYEGIPVDTTPPAKVMGVGLIQK